MHNCVDSMQFAMAGTADPNHIQFVRFIIALVMMGLKSYVSTAAGAIFGLFKFASFHSPMDRFIDKFSLMPIWTVPTIPAPTPRCFWIGATLRFLCGINSFSVPVSVRRFIAALSYAKFFMGLHGR